MNPCKRVMIAGFLMVLMATPFLSSLQVLASIGYGAPQCTGPGENPNVFGRCLTKGYFTGQGANDSSHYMNSKGQDAEYLTSDTPLSNNFNYLETWSGVDQWVFPQVEKAGVYNFNGTTVAYGGGPAVRNPAYANMFVRQLRAYLYADISQTGPNRCVSGAYYKPANGTEPPAGYNAAANKTNLNYFLAQIYDPNDISAGSTCFNLRRNAVGTAAIIATMFNKKGTDFGTYQAGIAYAKANFSRWQQMITTYDALGWVNWNAHIVAEPGHLNTTGTNGGSDIEWFKYPNRSYNANSIVFQDPTDPASTYTINRKCANLIGATSLKEVPQFDLQPSIAATPAYVEQGTPVTFDPSVNNSGVAPSAGTPYNISYTTTPAGGNPATVSGTRSFPSGVTNLPDTTVATTSYPPGTKVCAKLTVGPPAAYNYPGSRSAQACATVVAKPYFNVTGGDASAGAGMAAGGVDCGVPQNNQASIVSWNRGAAAGYAGAGSQYGTMAMNRLQDFAAAQGTALNRPSGLAFANTNGGGVTRVSTGAGLFGGKVGASACVPDYFAGSTAVAGNRTIGAQTITNGSHTKIYVDGDAYITGDIKFSGSYANYSQIPSYTVIVRGNIYIDRSVRQLDGVYIAQPRSAGSGDGNIYSCALGLGNPAPLASTMYNLCTTPLTVNGAFVARQVWLQRSAGTVAKNIPAETFNYTPEVWIAPPSGTAVTGKVDTYDAITSLPPVL